jgi:hypothetical protein
MASACSDAPPPALKLRKSAHTSVRKHLRDCDHTALEVRGTFRDSAIRARVQLVPQSTACFTASKTTCALMPNRRAVSIQLNTLAQVAVNHAKLVVIAICPQPMAAARLRCRSEGNPRAQVRTRRAPVCSTAARTGLTGSRS